mmetsp:Transcript_66955/g.118545  ORF Transcript_66955/g.118545 Transcript_66955/m.118545 type:complete len:133 (-) Transcript_66955:127-525(-)
MPTAIATVGAEVVAVVVVVVVVVEVVVEVVKVGCVTAGGTYSYGSKVVWGSDEVLGVSDVLDVLDVSRVLDKLKKTSAAPAVEDNVVVIVTVSFFADPCVGSRTWNTMMSKQQQKKTPPSMHTLELFLANSA